MSEENDITGLIKSIKLLGDNSEDNNGDCSIIWGIDNVVLVNHRTKNKIEENYNNYLDFIYVNDEWYIMRANTFIDCLDYNKSELKKYKEHIVGVKEYVFKDNAKDVPIFKLVLGKINSEVYTYVTDEFKEFIEYNNFTGFKFEKLFTYE